MGRVNTVTKMLKTDTEVVIVSHFITHIHEIHIHTEFIQFFHIAGASMHPKVVNLISLCKSGVQ